VYSRCSRKLWRLDGLLRSSSVRLVGVARVRRTIRPVTLSVMDSRIPTAHSQLYFAAASQRAVLVPRRHRIGRPAGGRRLSELARCMPPASAQSSHSCSASSLSASAAAVLRRDPGQPVGSVVQTSAPPLSAARGCYRPVTIHILRVRRLPGELVRRQVTSGGRPATGLRRLSGAGIRRSTVTIRRIWSLPRRRRGCTGYQARPIRRSRRCRNVCGR